MAKCKQVMLKDSEIRHLLGLIDWVNQEGVYWGREDYFRQRMKTMKQKLEIAENIKLPTP